MKFISALTCLIALSLCNFYGRCCENHTIVYETHSAMLESEKWQYTRTVLQSLIDQSQDSVGHFGAAMKKYAHWLSGLSATAGSLYGGNKLTEHYRNLTGMRLFSVMAAVGYISILTTNTLFSFLSDAMEDVPMVCFEACTAFAAQWAHHKPKTPDLIHGFFDELARNYSTEGLLTRITKKQARGVIESILGTSLIVEKLYETAQINKSDSNRVELESNLREFVKVLLFVGMGDYREERENLQDAVEQEFKTQRTRWEYLAKTLGIVNPQRTFFAGLTHLIKKYQMPLAVGIGMPAGLVGGVHFSNYIWGFRAPDRDEKLMWARFLGPIGGVAIVSLITAIVPGGMDEELNKSRLFEFVRDWRKKHKLHAPRVIYPLFDELYRLYQKNHGKLTLDVLFVQEIYRIIELLWIKISILPDSFIDAG